MYRLIISELAHRDLDHIVSYIAVQLAIPSAATSFLDEVEECYQHLTANPFMYERCRDLRLEKEGYRKAIIKIMFWSIKSMKQAKLLSSIAFSMALRTT